MQNFSWKVPDDDLPESPEDSSDENAEDDEEEGMYTNVCAPYYTLIQ
jgi:hypothetical protein